MTPHPQPPTHGYREVFRVEVHHAYFRDGASRAPVTWGPVEQTAARLSALGMLCRIDAGTLSVMQPDGTSSPTAADLLFEVTTPDPWFVHYTDLDTPDPDTPLWFDTAHAPAADGGADTHAGAAIPRTLRSLHQGATVSAADRTPRAALPLALPQQQPKAGRHTTLCYLRMQYPPADRPGTTWTLTFGARAVVWQYVVRRAAGRTVFIRDAAGQITFAPVKPALPPGDDSAQVMRSQQAIAMHELATHRFQLVEATPHGEQILIDRLTEASPQALSQEWVNGRATLVATIPVNL